MDLCLNALAHSGNGGINLSRPCEQRLDGSCRRDHPILNLAVNRAASNSESQFIEMNQVNRIKSAW